MSGRVCVVFVAVLFAMLVPAFAQTESAGAATAAINCNQQAIASAKRSLSSVHITKLQKHCKQYHKALTTVSFFTNPAHRFLIAPRYKVWWAVPDKQWRNKVRIARAQLRYNLRQLQISSQRINQLVLSAWLDQAFNCIHGKEGDWNANTGNGYYGGLQMDISFQKTYGAEFYAQWGTANNWPVWAQMEAARRAYNSGRGFGPWPNTARDCGYSTAPVRSI